MKLARLVLPALSVLLAGAAICGCGPQSRHTATAGSSDAEVRTLDENRALTMIVQVLAEESVAQGPAWTIDIGHDDPLEVDVRLASSSWGIEWMSAQDRIDFGDAIPEPTTDGTLRIVPGHGDDADAHVLILEHTSYEFANEREHVQRGVPGAGDAEARLRQDVRDFLHYVSGQGGL